jgi:uncharacterized protein (DUF58 family)
MLPGVRQYQPGDSFNRIAWSATARTGQLMVKEFELDPSADVWLVLDGDARHHVVAHGVAGAGDTGQRVVGAILDSTEEYAVTITASLARYFLDLNRAVGVVASGGSRVVLPADRGARHLVKVLEMLALFRSDGRAPVQETLLTEQTRFGREAVVIVVTPSTDEAWVKALAELTTRSVRSLAIVIEPSTFGQRGQFPFSGERVDRSRDSFRPREVRRRLAATTRTTHGGDRDLQIGSFER